MRVSSGLGANQGMSLRTIIRGSFVGAVILAAACGPGVVVTTAGPGELRAALFASADELAVTPETDRGRLYDEMTSLAAGEATKQEQDAPVLFPIASGERLVAAPFAHDVDLLKPHDSAPAVDLAETPERWSEEPDPALTGASERDLATAVSRSLLEMWSVTERTTVVRSPAVPFAAAWVDGRLRVNPALLYLVAAHASSQQAGAFAAPAASVPKTSITVTTAVSAETPNPPLQGTPSVVTPVAAAVESSPASVPIAPTSLPLNPVGTAAALVAAGLFGSWLLRRR